MKFTIYILMVLISISFSCTAPGEDDPENEGAQKIKSPGIEPVATGIPNMFFEPLPVEYLNEVSTPGIDLTWRLMLKGLDRSEPPRELYVEAVYDNESGLLHGSTLYKDEDFGCYWEFPSNEPFLNIVSYFQEHPDVFFNYYEFDGQSYASGFVFGDGEKIESLTLTVIGHYFNPSYNGYAICKGITTGEPPVPEIEYAIELIKTEIMDEVLLHPEN